MFKKADELDNLVRKMDSGTDVLGFHAPVIGISGNFREGDCTLAQGYYMSVLEAGGTPVVIPPYDNQEALVSLLDSLDGIVLSGGADIDPDYLREEALDCVSVNPRRDAQELLLVRLAVDRSWQLLLAASCIRISGLSMTGRALSIARP